MSQQNGTWELSKWHGPAAPDKRNHTDDRLVSFLGRQEDFDCLMLANFGMELQTIADYTGLSKGQVTYRLKKAGVQVRAFRKGHGVYANMVFAHLDKRAARQVITEVRSVKQLN